MAATQRSDNFAQQLVLQELILAAQHAMERLKRIEVAMAEFLPGWSLAPVVDALQALREIRMFTAANIMGEIGDLRRFDNPRQLMGYILLMQESARRATAFDVPALPRQIPPGSDARWWKAPGHTGT